MDRQSKISFPSINSHVVLGDCLDVMGRIPKEGIQLVFTSPPYYNARPEYYTASSYEAYIEFLVSVFKLCHDALSEGRFLVINTSPVLVPRASRSDSSRRRPIAFDMHHKLDSIGYEYIDDIVWEKPEGAGWST